MCLSIFSVITGKRSRRHSRSRSRRRHYSRSEGGSSLNGTLPPQPQPQPPAPTDNSGMDKSADVPTEKELSSEILDVIGKRIEEEKALAPPVHKDFAVRWAEIMKLGLSDEERVELCKKYPPPKNCEFFKPPKLNAEVYRAINDNVRARDKRITDKQGKLVASLSSIAKVFSSFLERDNTEDIHDIEALSDASRLIADFVHDEISIRRSLILSNVSASMRETLNSASVDDCLFGNKLVDELKSAKLVEQSAQDLRISKSSTNQYKTSKNVKGPSRSQNKGHGSTSNGQKQTTSSSSRNHQPRSHQSNQSHYSQRSSVKKSYYQSRRH